MEDAQKDEWRYAPEGSWRIPLDQFNDSIPEVVHV